jgi:hypothetical protein
MYKYMPKNRTSGESGKAILAIVIKEMAKPRMAKSAREFETNLAATRIAQGKARKYKLKLHLLALPQGACS